ncbi:MAG: PLP-dependent aminotransferase family protein [Planctomycetota bacterium]
MTIWAPQLTDGVPQYLAIVNALARDVASGELPQGTQLPPQRDLARALAVSLGTVTRAYTLAEKRGLVRGEVGRGTFVGSAQAHGLPIGDTGCVVGGGINLGMTWPLEVENPDLAPALRQLVRRKDLSDLLQYQPNAGMAHHRAAGATWLAWHGLEVAPGRVLICGGAQHAMTVALAALVQPGETLLAEELTYPGVRAVADFLRLKVTGIRVDRDGLVPEAFDAACRAKRAKVLYSVPSIHNPTATTLAEERRRAIAEIARRHDVWIIEDAIHHLLLDDPPPPLARFAPERTLCIASPSKVVAGGLRVAYLAAPESALEKLIHGIWATNWLVAPLNAEILSIWIEDGTAATTIARKKTEAAARVAMLREALRDHDVVTADTGYHAWLTLPRAWGNAVRFVEEARRQGVMVTPAETFHVGSGAPPCAVRVSLSASPTRETLRRGLERLSATLAGEPSRVGPAVV